ncbi:GLPGLI family protein [Chryseobacterium sp. ERMR1:04]|uniref:GLPGLI family protein n=1 Tax=Chryseobacterium sp. ERMR1:04 TaxID=1705393 RepID=UPI0006C85C9C|nr:GLPGLI family protein [Chryseobacterium sp. ERMR1:04]KPH14635.1 hypothetical protein AMQ68_04025 [Chryseobacterium sp. ERMR1:04]
MKTVFLSAFCFLTGMAQSQTHRFIYDVEYKKDSTQSLTTKENYHLDIGSKDAKYYIRDFFTADSLIVNNIPFPKDLKMNTSNIVVHKLGANDYEEYDMLEGTILKLQTKDSQDWKLTNEKKKVKSLNLQKATAHWGGRNWIAWFTSDIPFQEGPYKFHGLPGLIVELYDDKNNYKFELVQSQKVNQEVKNQFIDYSTQKSILVNREKYVDAKRKYYDSPVNYLRNASGGAKSSDEYYLNDGTLVGQANSREVNLRLKENIKKYNNPIELDKAIQYPL